MEDRISVAEISEKFRALNTSLIADALRSHSPERLVMQGVNALTSPNQTVAGPARTLRFLPPRADLKPAGNYRQQLIDTVGKGEVLVFDAASIGNFPVFGDMTALRALQNRAAGCVTDGFVRDVTAVEEIGFPIFARGPWPSANSAFPVAWEMDVPIQCGGVTVVPGDWVVGDADGVLVIPPALVAVILEKASVMVRQEEFARQLLIRGHSLAECYPVRSELLPLFDRWASSGVLPTNDEVSEALRP